MKNKWISVREELPKANQPYCCIWKTTYNNIHYRWETTTHVDCQSDDEKIFFAENYWSPESLKSRTDIF